MIITQLRQMLERVQNYGMRLILSKPPRTHSEELRQELGWTTLERRREVSRMKLMHRCVTDKSQVLQVNEKSFDLKEGI